MMDEHEDQFDERRLEDMTRFLETAQDKDIFSPFRPMRFIDSVGYILQHAVEIDLDTLLRLLYVVERTDLMMQSSNYFGGRPYVTEAGVIIKEMLDMILDKHESSHLWKEHFAVNEGIVSILKKTRGGSLSQYARELLLDKLSDSTREEMCLYLPEERGRKIGEVIPLTDLVKIFDCSDYVIKHAREEIYFDALFGTQQ